MRAADTTLERDKDSEMLAEMLLLPADYAQLFIV